jgi:uracil phosphoribosyltransferase
MKKVIDKVVLVEAAVLTGGNYTWIIEELTKVGFAHEDILTLALVEHKDSVFKSKIVGDYVSEVPTFYWEEYNKHWE